MVLNSLPTCISYMKGKGEEYDKRLFHFLQKSVFIHSLPYFNLYVTHATRALHSHDLSGERINSGSHFLTTQGHGDPPRMRDQLNVGATSETTRTWKTLHTIHSHIHSNKANMKWWLWRPNDIRGPWGPNVFWNLSDTWGKTPTNTAQST